MLSFISSSRRRAAALPSGLLIGLGFFLAGDHAFWSAERPLRLVTRYTPPGPDGDALIVEDALRRLPRAAGAAPPVLLLGSSQVREGLDCAAFEHLAPGASCHNLAISAGAPLDVLHIVNAADRRAPRRVSVLGVFPKVLHMPPKRGFVGGATFGCLFGSGAWQRVGAAHWVDLSGGLLENFAPTLRYKDALAAAYDVVRRDPEGAWRQRLAPQPRRLLAGLPPQPPAYFASRVGHVDGDAPRPNAFTPVQETALERFLDREQALGNATMVIDFPTRPGYETTLPAETRAHYAAFLGRLRVRAGIAFVAAEDLRPLGLADFQDFTHLSEAGRAKVSARIARRLLDDGLLR